MESTSIHPRSSEDKNVVITSNKGQTMVLFVSVCFIYSRAWAGPLALHMHITSKLSSPDVI